MRVLWCWKNVCNRVAMKARSHRLTSGLTTVLKTILHSTASGEHENVVSTQSNKVKLIQNTHHFGDAHFGCWSYPTVTAGLAELFMRLMCHESWPEKGKIQRKKQSWCHNMYSELNWYVRMRFADFYRNEGARLRH